MKIGSTTREELELEECLPEELTPSGNIQPLLPLGDPMKIILIEGPDKCGKTTFIKKMAKQGHLTAALPSREFKAKLMAEPEKYNNSKAFFEDAIDFWQNKIEKLVLEANIRGVDIYLDRDILSMLAYQGILNQQMPLIDLAEKYAALCYRRYMPTEVWYLTNKPFASYEENDPIEKQGYQVIRDAYEKVIALPWLERFIGSKIKLVELDYEDLH